MGNMPKTHYKITFIFILIFSLFVSIFTNGEDITALSNKIQKIVEESPVKGDGSLGIYFGFLNNEKVIFKLNEDTPLTPASCNKLLPTSAGFYYLTPDFIYETNIYYVGKAKDGLLKGDIVIVGSGDPSICGRWNNDDITKTLKDWADVIKGMGINTIEGDIVGDDDYFDEEYWHESWYPAERGEWYEAENSALSLNDNCVDIFLKGAENVDEPATYELDPKSNYYKFSSNVKTSEKGKGSSIEYKRQDKSNTITADGKIGIGKKSHEYFSIYNPTLYFTTVFKETLEAKGIKVKGDAKDIDDLDSSRKKNLKDDKKRKLIAIYKSPPLSEICRIINHHSQNLYADMVLKTISAKKDGKGSFPGGVEWVKKFLKEVNINPEGLVMVDGSGLSYLNKVKPIQLAELLRVMKKRYGDLFISTLPKGGQGSLYDRFNDDDYQKEVKQNIRGKTGWIGGVNSVTGVITNKAGTEIVYSIIQNEYSGKKADVITLMDKICVEVAHSEVK